MSHDTPSERDDLRYVAEIEDVPEKGPLVVDVKDREIGIYNIGGEFHALANYCIHQGGPLCEGPVSGTLDVDESYELIYSREDEIVSCPWHGWQFDIQTGEHLARDEFNIPTYDIHRQNGSLYLEI
jgi:nitrite reductase/ring-hydroxylating ferredoxin subunit